jgi:hypothetical protein
LARKTLLFTCGWAITEADEAAIAAVLEDALEAIRFSR